MDQKPFIFLYRYGERWNGVFAILLNSCPSKQYEKKEYRSLLENHIHYQIDFINSLFSPYPEKSFTLRYITYPDPTDYASGKINLILFGQIKGKSQKSDAEDRTLELFQEVVSLLGGSFPDYEWIAITKQQNFKNIWEPFDFNGAFVAEIRRREDVVNLAVLPPRPTLGRGRSHHSRQEDAESNVYLIHRFVPQVNSFSRLLRTLLLHPSPIIFQVSIEPVLLRKDEVEKFIEQISKCEKYIKVINSTPAIKYTKENTLHLNRAQSICQILLEQLARLQDAPYVLQIYLISPKPLPRILVETTGVEITEPVGGKNMQSTDRKTNQYTGGYDVVYPSSEEDAIIASENFTKLLFSPWGECEAPDELSRLRYLVDATEAAAAFRLPFVSSEGLPGIRTRIIRYLPLPREVARISKLDNDTDKILIGEHKYLGFRHKVYMKGEDRKQHLYIVGQTGTGKTTLLRTMIIEDIYAGKGLAVIDPHGDLLLEVLNYIPQERLNDVVLFDPTDTEYPVGFNLLENTNEEERYFIVREMRSIMERLLYDQYGSAGIEYAGPLFYQHMQMNMLLAMSNNANPGTLLEFYEIYKHRDYWKRWLPLKWDDPLLMNWVENTLKNLNYTERYRDGLTMGEYLSSKFDDFIFDPKLRYIFGQKQSKMKIQDIMDNGKIFLVNLAKGKLAEANARFLGMVLMAKIQSAAIGRVSISQKQRRIFNLYVDEFQSIATENFLLMLSEARKFGLNLILANQFISQIKDQRIMQSIFGNVGSIISFRTGQEDATVLEPHFLPAYDRYSFTNLPNWHAIMKTTVAGQTVTPFMIHTVLADKNKMRASSRNVRAIRDLSRKQYSTPLSKVKVDIEKSFRLE